MDSREIEVVMTHPTFDNAVIRCPECGTWFALTGPLGFFPHVRVDHATTVNGRQLSAWLNEMSAPVRGGGYGEDLPPLRPVE